MNESLNIVFTGKDEIEIRHEALAPLEAGQLLVQTQSTLISTGTECICLGRKFAPDTNWHNWVQYPFYPGYSNAGRVLDVAEGVTAFRPGDRIASRSQHRQYCLVDQSEAQLIPEGVADEAATWFGLACIVQNGVRRAAHELGDNVVVIGLGLLGQLVVQYLRCLGAGEIIAIDTIPARLEMARAHGATHLMQTTVQEARAEVERLTGGRRADVVYDVTGHHDVLAPALGLVRRFGKLLLLGDTGTPAQQTLASGVLTEGLTIIGAHDSNPPSVPTDRDWWTKPHMAELFFRFLARGQMDVDSLITHRYSPTQASQAYALLQENRAAAMGVLFDWTQLPQ